MMTSAPASRGAIVPLLDGRPHTATAFIAAGDGSIAREGNQDDAHVRESAGKLNAVPTLRRGELHPSNAAPPQLSRSYPNPLDLLGIHASVLQGVGSDNENDNMSKRHPSPASENRPFRHTIVDGDTLPALAARYLGEEEMAAKIYAANRNVLASPDLLPIGAEIVITP